MKNGENMGFWTKAHLVTVLPTFVVLLIIALLMRKWLLKKPYETRMIPIKIISVIILLIEIGKQAVSVSRGSDPYHLPLHFCSIFVFVLPLFAFYRGKGKEKAASVACASMIALFIGMLIIPNVIYADTRIETFFEDYLSFHTVFFHNLVIFALFLSLSLDLHRPSGKRAEILFVALFGLAFSLIAAAASHLLETNFSNFLYSTVSIIEALTEKVRAVLGDAKTTVIYTSALSSLIVLLMLAADYIYLALCIAKDKLARMIGTNQ